MSAHRSQRVEELFQEVLDKDESQREAYLREQCQGDASLREAVEELLHHYRAATPAFLGGSINGVLQTPAGEPAPSRIGRYTIIRKIGEGGMGIVYEAVQDQPRRNVALKVIRGAITSSSIRRRFEFEAEILGRLKHPGIAQIYEAATTTGDGSGQPYYAMELIAGDPVVEYARQKRLNLRQRLELVAQVCDAVQFAHQQGVIHRDLKPANILVEDTPPSDKTCSHESMAQPKVLDFGIARLVESNHTMTLQTEPGQVIGSVPYMSPEQILGTGRDLDTRCDVYALGVVMFELLSENLPYELAGKSLPEIARIVADQPPRRLGALNEACLGDVETIAEKALAKEKERRYASAGELAAEIRRFLHDEPILAHPPSRMYQLRRFARRNRALVGGVFGMFIALLLGIAGTTAGLVRARRAEQVASERLVQTQREAAKFAAVNRFLETMLSAADPGIGPGRSVTVEEILADAVKELDSGSLHDQPDVEAAVRGTMGSTLFALGKYAESEAQLRKAVALRTQTLGPTAPELASSLRDLALAITNQGRYAEAEQLYRQALDIDVRCYGEAHAEVAQSCHDLASSLRAQSKLDEAEPLYRRALAIRENVLGPDHLDTAQTVNSLALLAQNREDLESAEQLFRRSLDIRRRRLGDSHPDVAGSLNNLGNLLRFEGKNEECESTLREALEMRKKLFGDEHPLVAQSTLGLAAFLHSLERYDEAEPMYREATRVYRKLVGHEHPDLANAVQSLALMLQEIGSYEESETLYRESWEIRRKVFGERHLTTALSIAALGTLFLDTGRFVEAETLERQALEVRQAQLPVGHWQIVLTQNALAAAVAGQGRSAEARGLFDESSPSLVKVPAFANRRRNDAIRRAVQFYESQGEISTASQYHTMLDTQPGSTKR